LVKAGERIRLVFSMQIPGRGRGLRWPLRHRTRIDIPAQSTRGVGEGDP
jgi:hypothetical protein